MPRALDELHDTDPATISQHAQRQPESCRRLALAGTRIDDKQAFFCNRLARNLGILNRLALLHPGAMALGLAVIDRLHHFTCMGRPATMNNTRPATDATRWFTRP